MSDVTADGARDLPSPRDRLLDAALAVFSSKGFMGATTKEIALRADVNEVTLFRNFDNKAGLFDAVLRERFPRSQLIRELHFDRSATIDKALADNSARLLAILRSNRDYAKVAFLDLPRTDRMERSDPFSTAFVGPLVGYLAVSSDLGILKPIEVEPAAELLYGILRHHFVRNYIEAGNGPDQVADRRFSEAAVKLFLDGLRLQCMDGQIPQKQRAKR